MGQYSHLFIGKSDGGSERREQIEGGGNLECEGQHAGVVALSTVDEVLLVAVPVQEVLGGLEDEVGLPEDGEGDQLCLRGGG